MSRSSIVALVIGAILFGCGAGMVAHEVLESEAEAYDGQLWEYKLHTRSMNVKKDMPVLNALGEQGWELVDYEEGGFFLKRPLN
jgi:hypothetical protein